MTISFDNALGVHADALRLRGLRTELLARNIAHGDTPGYKARDIDFKAELARQIDGHVQGQTAEHMTTKMNGHMNVEARSNLNATHARHFPIHLQTGPSQHPDVSIKYRVPLMASFDGNSVNTQQEQAAFAENNMQLQAAMQFLDGRFKGLKTAIKGE